jgi:hypothetical protein
MSALPPAGYWRCKDGVERLYSEMGDEDVLRCAWILSKRNDIAMGRVCMWLIDDIVAEAYTRGIGQRLPAYLKTQCDLCGKKALYRVGHGAFCKTHQGTAQARRLVGCLHIEARASASEREFNERDRKLKMIASLKRSNRTVEGRRHS